MPNMPEVKEIPYVRTDGKAKKAHIVPVSFSLDGLSEEEILVLGHLSEASNGITPIYAKQNYGKALELFRALESFERFTPFADIQKVLDDYNTLFAIKNSPWNAIDGKGMKFPLSLDQVKADGCAPLNEFLDLLLNDTPAPPGRNLYPLDATDDELKAVEVNLHDNTSVIRGSDGKLKLVTHEMLYKNELRPVISSLERALSAATNESLRNYIQAKINQFRSGSREESRNSDLAWLQNESPLDFIMGTAVESYLDRIKGVVSCAQGAVYRTDNKYQGFCKTLMDTLPELEARAPWMHKKKVDKTNLPKLKFVDVAAWSGGYDLFPKIVLAESLPNEEEFRQKYGSVNVVFANIQETLSRTGAGQFIRKEFLPSKEAAKYGLHLPYMGLIMTAIHEVGHASGDVIIKEEPHRLFGRDYSKMEEARAELFSMFALPIFREKGLISEEQEIAGYYKMATALVEAMQRAPNDHAGARNMMFHYFLERNALVEKEEEGKIKYAVNPEKMRIAVPEMLGTLADIRAIGDKEALAKFMDKYLSEARRKEFEERFSDAPEGTGLIFPKILADSSGFVRSLVYPATFREQPRTLGNFV